MEHFSAGSDEVTRFVTQSNQFRVLPFVAVNRTPVVKTANFLFAGTVKKSSYLEQLGKILKRHVGAKGRRNGRLDRKRYAEGAVRRRPPGRLRGKS